MAKRISIYMAPTLERALAERTDEVGSLRSKSALVAAIADRYAEMCVRSMPLLSLQQWLLICDALNGCWTLDNASLAARSIALEVADACRGDQAHAKWGLSGAEGAALAETIDNLSFAAQVAVLDAAERFWILGVHLDGAEVEGDPWAGWRAPVRALVGRLADDE